MDKERIEVIENPFAAVIPLETAQILLDDAGADVDLKALETGTVIRGGLVGRWLKKSVNSKQPQ